MNDPYIFKTIIDFNELYVFDTNLNRGSPFGRAPAQAGERDKKTPSPSAHAATSPQGRGYIVFLYLSVETIRKLTDFFVSL